MRAFLIVTVDLGTEFVDVGTPAVVLHAGARASGPNESALAECPQP